MKKEKENGWIKKFSHEFLEKPGEHLIEVGITGSGKTQFLYWIIDGLVHKSPGEYIVWFDTGKSSELLTLAKFKPLNIIIPSGNEVHIQNLMDYRVREFKNIKEIWCDLLDKDRINVVCIEPYILDPAIYTHFFKDLFKELIILAHDGAVPIPLAVFVDEFHRVAPSKGNALDYKQFAMGAIIQHNIERLRSLHIRFICSTHGWSKIRAGARNSFNWIVARRGAHFSSDQPKLHRFNPLFEKLTTDVGIITFPTKIFTDMVHFPYYEKGEDIGKVKYSGVYEKTSTKQDTKIKSPWKILGINEGASWEEIKAAYHEKVKKYHPDKMANLAPEFIKLAEEMMKEINTAYEELKKMYANGS